MSAHSAEKDARLRAVAEAADDGGRPWEWAGGYPQQVIRQGDAMLVAETYEGPDFPSTIAEFIAAFDPPTVLGLLDALRAARRTARDAVAAAERDSEALEGCREQRGDLLALLEVEREQHADALMKVWHEGYGAGSSDATDGWLNPGSPRTANPYTRPTPPAEQCSLCGGRGEVYDGPRVAWKPCPMCVTPPDEGRAS